MKPTFDSSVRFFGLDWNHTFRVARNLVELTGAILEVIKDSIDASNEIDLILPR